MWVGLNFAATQDRYNGFLARARPAFAQFIESWLLHDIVVVPTDDYLTLTAIVDCLGDRATIALLESGILRFLRIRGTLGYVGGGGGVVGVSFPFKGDGTDASAVGAEVPDAVTWALRGLRVKPDLEVAKQAVQHTTELDLSIYKDGLATAAYDDFRQLPFGKELDPRCLPGVTNKQVQILGGQDLSDTNDMIQVVLALATANLELRLMAESSSTDNATTTPIGHALRAREIRLGQPHQAFGELRQLTEVPDIAEAVLSRKLSVDALLELRNSMAGAAFRSWFHLNCAQDPSKTTRAYIDLLSAVPTAQKKPVKALRFLITTALGFIPIVGGLVGLPPPQSILLWSIR